MSVGLTEKTILFLLVFLKHKIIVLWCDNIMVYISHFLDYFHYDKHREIDIVWLPFQETEMAHLFISFMISIVVKGYHPLAEKVYELR